MGGQGSSSPPASQAPSPSSSSRWRRRCRHSVTSRNRSPSGRAGRRRTAARPRPCRRPGTGGRTPQVVHEHAQQAARAAPNQLQPPAPRRSCPGRWRNCSWPAPSGPSTPARRPGAPPPTGRRSRGSGSGRPRRRQAPAGCSASRDRLHQALVHSSASLAAAPSRALFAGSCAAARSRSRGSAGRCQPLLDAAEGLPGPGPGVVLGHHLLGLLLQAEQQARQLVARGASRRLPLRRKVPLLPAPRPSRRRSPAGWRPGPRGRWPGPRAVTPGRPARAPGRPPARRWRWAGRAPATPRGRAGRHHGPPGAGATRAGTTRRRCPGFGTGCWVAPCRACSRRSRVAWSARGTGSCSGRDPRPGVRCRSASR